MCVKAQAAYMASFSESGLASKYMEGVLVSKIQSTITGWRQRKLSLYGRVLLANSVLLAKLWYAARITPFSEAFYKLVRKSVSEFIWNGRSPKVAWDIVTKPKRQGGLGLLPIEAQSQAVFAQFIASMFNQHTPPWWAATAHWALDQRLGQANHHSSYMLWNEPPARLYIKLPAFWKHVLRVWQKVKGRLPGNTVDIPTQSLLGLPLEHPLVTSNFDPSVHAKKRLRENRLFTLGDVFMRNSENGSAISRPGDRLAPFVMAYKAVRIRFQPTALSRLLDYPTETNPRTVWSYAQMSGMPLKAYKPSLGRKAIESAQIVPLNTAKWTIEEDQGETAVQATARTAKARWAKIPKIPLEQKQLSLLWLMAHAAVPTASKLSHYIPDLPPECKFCYTLSESNAADNSAVSDSQHAPRETIVHYFWLCPRIQEFWQRVSCFIQGIRDAPSGPVFTVDLRAVVTGFGAWSRRIPNADVLHGLAVWEIFRARAELSLDGKRLDGLAMFLWKSAVISRILHDFYYSYSMIKAPHIFKKRWLTVSNRWYHFDPGDDELDGKISFRNESQQVAGRLHHIIQYHQQSAPDDDTNAPAAPDNLPIVA